MSAFQEESTRAGMRLALHYSLKPGDYGISINESNYYDVTKESVPRAHAKKSEIYEYIERTPICPQGYGRPKSARLTYSSKVPNRAAISNA